jgi:DNA-nicking Smr family endonuclease
MARRAKPKKKADAGADPFFRPFSKLKPARAATKEPAGAPKAEPPEVPPKRSRPAPPAGSRASDADTFALYMAGVRELDRRVERIPRTASRIDRAGAAETGPTDLDAPARERMWSLVGEGLRFETLDDGDRIEGRRIEVDPRELRRLRRGQYAVDGKLDLHGMGVVEARAAVEAFVKKRRGDGDRVVVIVHGKGAHSPRGLGVLRGEIAAWLSQGRAARQVAAFATAPEEQGGTGALLVLLAR